MLDVDGASFELGETLWGVVGASIGDLDDEFSDFFDFFDGTFNMPSTSAKFAPVLESMPPSSSASLLSLSFAVLLADSFSSSDVRRRFLSADDDEDEGFESELELLFL